MQLEGKVALITGGGTGIGAAVARRFVAEGASVVLMGRRPELIDSVAAEVGGEAVHGDAGEPDDARRAVERARERFGGLDIVIANAGQGHMNAAVETTDEQWAESWHANPTTAFCTMRAALPSLIERRGAAVLISSVAGIGAGPRIAAYTTSKHGVLGFTKALAAELGKDGVRVNAIGPGLIETPLNAAVRANNPELVKVFLDHTPLGRAGKPEDIVGPAVFLASDLSAYVTGTIVMADGGYRTI